jgi:hypothetical protein
MKSIVLDDSVSNSDWIKQGKYGFDFPFVETVEDFERQFRVPSVEPARGKRLEELAKLPWVDVAPEPIRVLLLGVRKSVVLRKMVVRRDAMVQLAFIKASFGGNRSEAGRYAAEQRWKGHVRADAEQILRVRGGIIDTVRREEGMSVKIDSGLQPKDGYMVARKEYSKIVSAEDFFDATKGKKILGDFLKENRERFQKDQYLGIWWNTKTGKVYLDITDNISDRSKAESLGKERNQISIWDVVNKVEIQTGGTGEG